MDLILDTHIFIWSVIASKRLSASIRAALEDDTNLLFLSIASIWEMQLKLQTGKLIFPIPLPDVIKNQQQLNDLQILSIKPEHIYELETMPFHHKDPFDRLIIAQTIIENFTLVSTDPVFSAYPVSIFS